jgi:CBS domain containing-hemolysin-like protein
MTVLIISLAVALTISFSCSMLEACLLSISNADLARIAEKHTVSANIWKKFKANIQKPLAVILIVNTMANVVGASIAAAEFSKLFGSKWIGLFSLCVSYIMIQWTEILPKTIGVKFNRLIAQFVAVPFSGVVYLFQPLVLMIEILNRPFVGRKKENTASAVSDIRVLARSAFLENLISKEQEGIISRSMHLSTLTAADTMIPRQEINVLDTRMTLTDGLIAAHQQRHTRFPLAENGNIDAIIGYVNFKDIVGALHVNPADPSLRGIMRPVLYVKNSAKTSELLPKLTRGYHHIAIVQDDNKNTTGLVTLEDIIETLVGDLQDEYDTPPDFIIALAENRFRVGGNAVFRQIRARAFSDLPRDDEMTVDKWFKHESGGKLPTENSAKKLGGFTLKVRRIVRGNIYDVILERTSPA